jgi:hypothetical protein
VLAPLARPIYRTRQFILALFPRVQENERQVARSLLSEAEWRLFETMEPRDQRHGIEVMGRLLARGVSDADILGAALLHDCGKGRIPVWLRVALVASPWLVRRIAAAEGPDWRRAAYRLLHHERLSAALASEAGCSPVTVRLISGIVSSETEESALALLRAADDAS